MCFAIVELCVLMDTFLARDLLLLHLAIVDQHGARLGDRVRFEGLRVRWAAQLLLGLSALYLETLLLTLPKGERCILARGLKVARFLARDRFEARLESRCGHGFRFERRELRLR